MSLFDHPLVTALTPSLGAFILGILLYRRSIKVDKTTVISEAQAARDAYQQRIVQGLDTLNDSLQEDNKGLRLEVKDLKQEVTDLKGEVKGLRVEITGLKEEIKKLTETKKE